MRPLERDHHAHEQRREEEPARRQVPGVEQPDHRDRQQVIDDRQREQERAHPRRQRARRQHEDRQRERQVGRHRHAPALARRRAVRDRKEHQRRHEHAADRAEARSDQQTTVAKVAGRQLALDLEPGQQEEQGHQALVDPEAQVLRDRPSPETQHHRREPHLFVAAPPRRVDPHERDRDRDEHRQRARGRGTQELLHGTDDDPWDGTIGARPRRADVLGMGWRHVGSSCRPVFPARLRRTVMLAGASTRCRNGSSRLRHDGYRESAGPPANLRGALANDKTPLRDTAPATPERAQKSADRSTVARRRVIVGIGILVVLGVALFLLLGGNDSPLGAIGSILQRRAARADLRVHARDLGLRSDGRRRQQGRAEQDLRRGRHPGHGPRDGAVPEPATSTRRPGATRARSRICSPTTRRNRSRPTSAC